MKIEKNQPALPVNHLKVGVGIAGNSMGILISLSDDNDNLTVEMPALLTRKMALDLIEGIKKSLELYDQMKQRN
jgi:hypothetical protein